MIKETEIGDRLIESIDTVYEAIYEIYSAAEENKHARLYTILSIAKELLESIYSSITLLYSENEIMPKVNESIVGNVIASIDNIEHLSKVRSPKLLDKIQFELLPLVKLLYATFYFIAFADGVKEKEEKFINGLGHELFLSESMRAGIETGEYKYDVSILVVAYNKLEYTKSCIESILKNTPSHINYELILLNHGSTDGTREYFESLGCTKQIDLCKNGLSNVIAYQVIEGRFLCSVSNDIIVGENYLENMLACFESDPTVKYVVPTTPNISNLQTIPCEFSNIEEMKKFVSKNNKRDFYRWEQRCRLINPISLYRNEFFFKNNIFLKSYLHFRKFGAFGDDYFSLCTRRLGGKCILAKDSFCYHFGSVTLKDDESHNKPNHYQKGRDAFTKFTGVDPWGVGFCYDKNLFKNFVCKKEGEVKVLGINCGLGSNPLKIKETIKEEMHNTQTKVYNLTDNASYLEDLKGVSDYVEKISSVNEIKSKFPNITFDYIVCENGHKNRKMIENAMTRLADNGIIYALGIKIGDVASINSDLYPNEKWFIYTKNKT